MPSDAGAGAARPARRKARLGFLAIVLVGLAWICLVQAPGANQNAHLALVTALAHGTPRVDPHRNWTGDVAYIHGHYYADKAPGLAFATLPWYLALDGLGLKVAGPPASVSWPAAQAAMPATAVWEVGLFGATLPALVLLLLLRSVGEQLVPGYGTIAALSVGTASLLAVLATMFFAHSLSSCLGFGAFTVLFRERRGPPRLALVAVAGLLAGLAVVVEFPLGIVAVAMCVYAALRNDRLRRIGAYAAGVLVGITPLLAFNTWAFGSPTVLSYTNAVISPGANGHEVLGANASGFFGVGVPHLRAGLELLFSGHGLFVLWPVLALAGVGLVSLWKSGNRAEAAVAGGVGACFLLYDASYWKPFGGFPAGPRFLVPALPFLALGVAAAWRTLPRLTATLFVASAAVTIAALAGEPLGSSQSAGAWFHRLEHGQATRTVFSWTSAGHDGIEVLPVVVLLVAAVAIALVVTPGLRFDLRLAGLALAALVAWRIVYAGAPIMLTVDDDTHGWAGLAGVLSLAVAVPLAFVAARRRPAALLPAALLLPVAWPRFAAHTGIAFATIVVAAGGLALLAWLPPPAYGRLIGRRG